MLFGDIQIWGLRKWTSLGAIILSPSVSIARKSRVPSSRVCLHLVVWPLCVSLSSCVSQGEVSVSWGCQRREGVGDDQVLTTFPALSSCVSPHPCPKPAVPFGASPLPTCDHPTLDCSPITSMRGLAHVTLKFSFSVVDN